MFRHGGFAYQRHAFVDVRAARLVVDLAWVGVHEVAREIVGVEHDDVIVVQASALQHLVRLRRHTILTVALSSCQQPAACLGGSPTGVPSVGHVLTW